MRLIYDNQFEISHVIHINRLIFGNNLRFQVIFAFVFLPHLAQVSRTDDKSRCSKRLFVYLGYRTCGNRLSQSNHIANHSTIKLVITQMAYGNLDCCLLKLEKVMLENRRQGIFRDTGTRILAEMISRFHVDVVWRKFLLSRPRLLKDFE